MEGYFGADQKRISHALRVLGYAKEIMLEAGGDPEVVIAAAILHDIGIHEAERKYGSASGHYQEIEGPPIAEKILKQTGFPTAKTAEVLEIIAHHHTPGKIHSANFKILSDADWLVNLGDEADAADKNKLARVIERVFMTETGKKLAREKYIQR